ncbi:MAG: paraquat-inducible protein A [Nitrospirales bacterium]|nr:paraquat-inducible protein A [Nitrospirales bacterium]
MIRILLEALIACHNCDLLHQRRFLQHGEWASCTRCGACLYQHKQDSLNRTLSLTLSSFILIIGANVFPFMTFKLQGRVQEALLLTGVQELYLQEMGVLAILVLAVGVLFPLLKIFGILYVLLPLKLGRRSWKAIPVFRFVETLHPWAMMEVYLLGVIVAYVKLVDFATIVLGSSLYAFVGLILTMAAADAFMDSESIWDELEVS